MEVLSADFYRRETILVAQELLGKVLVRKIGDLLLKGRIVETEAYIGVEDPACHTWKNRKSERTHPMYMAGGLSYVYLIYGMYHCFNVVTQKSGEPEAVLVRAIEPLTELGLMSEQRRHPKRAIDLANGPGKLCQALNINRSLSGVTLWQSDKLWIEDGPVVTEIESGGRIGVDYAGDAAYWPLRFFESNSEYVSAKTNY